MRATTCFLPITVFSRPSIATILLSFLCLVSNAAFGQTSTWSGGAGNWAPCPPQGNALWNTCPTYPDGKFNAVIQGGPVTLGPTNGISILNLTVAAGDTVIVTPGYLDITGTSIANNDTISVGPGNGLNILSTAGVTLSGSGNVTLNKAGARFWGSNPVATFTNQQTIEGQGSFAVGMNLINKGTINGNAGTFSMQPNTTVNTGVIEASNGSTLQFVNGSAAPYNNSGGTIQALNGGTVQFFNGIYTGGTLTTVGTGVLQSNANATFNGLTNNGALQVATGNTGVLQNTINNAGTITVPTATLYMTGNVTLKGTGNLLMTGSAHLQQFTGSGDTLTNQQLIHGSGVIYHLPLTNQGTVSADSSGNMLTLAGNTTTNTSLTSLIEATGGGTLMIEIDSTVANTGGTIEALNGSTVILSGTVNGGTLTTAGTGTVQSQNGTLDGTVHVPTNAGMLDVNNSDLSFQGTIHNTGTIALTGGSCVVMKKPSTLTGTGKLTMAPSTCIYGSGIAFTNSSTIQGAGSIGDSNPMHITNTGTIIANNPSSPLLIHADASGFTNVGTLTVNAHSTLNIQGLFNNLSNSGTLTGGTYSVTGMLGVSNQVVTNAASILLTGAAAEISNSGVNALSMLATNTSKGLLALYSGQVLTTKTSLSNVGIVTVGATSGLTVGGSYTQTSGTTTVDGSLTAPTGLMLQHGLLQGQGTVASAVNSGATVTAGDSTSKAGKLTIHGSYSEDAAGVLDVAIGGTQVGTRYSQLAVSNGASLNGTLNIKLINHFVPTIGSVFTILTANPVTGKFATVNGLSINSGEHFVIAYNYNIHPSDVTLTVASGP